MSITQPRTRQESEVKTVPARTTNYYWEPDAFSPFQMAERLPGVRWRMPYQTPETHPGGWRRLRITFDRLLTTDEALDASACLGYALRQYVNGEALPLPTIKIGGTIREGATSAEERAGLYTIMEFNYDSNRGRRSRDHTIETFRSAREYITNGTPIRTTDRAGAGTQGTRLVNGIGEVGIRFEVR